MNEFRTPSMSLIGKRALVTGSSKGIGLAAAYALAEAGASVTVVARSRADVDAAVFGIVNAGFKAEGVVVDVTDQSAVGRWLEGSPSFDILVNNAGTNRPDDFVNTSVEDFTAVFDINVKAAFFVTQGVVRKLLAEEKPGSIINVSSQMGHVGASRRTVYCASKHAIEGLTKALAAELGSAGIRVNTICPTFIETPMTKPFLADPDFRQFVLSKIKVGRLGVPEDVMGALVFLASDSSAMMTGSALMLDGGWTTTS